MDHAVRFEKDSSVMSQIPVGGVDLCDNLPNPEPLIAQAQNLNKTKSLTQMQSLSLSQTEEGGRHTPIQKSSLNNNGKDEEEQRKEVYTGRGREEDEEEDIDEVMREEDEKEEVDESSSLIGCQSSDSPMTDSSYSETGSLLEAQFPFSAGTSPEPNTSIIQMICPVEFSQRDADSHISNTKSLPSATGSFTLGLTFTTQPIDSTATVLSDIQSTSSHGSTCITGTMDRIRKNTSFATEHLISSTESILNHEPTCLRGLASSYIEPVTSAAEAFAVTTSTHISATTGPLTFSTGPMTTGTKSTSTTGPKNSNREHITSMPVPTCFALSTCSTGPIPRLAPMESLEQLTQKEDDAHFPQYLHQIAETFVLQEDSDQWALWCIQLERLYHQRLLENLNALQKQWEKQCRKTSSDLKIHHLETLKHICLTHSRPRARDAVCASLDCLMSTFEESGALPACTSAHEVRGMEQRSEDPFYSQSGQAVIPSNNVTDSPEISAKDWENSDRELDERGNFHRSQLTECSDRERAEADVACTITVLGNGLHPSPSGEMDQSKPAEQQGGDLVPALEKEAKREEEERGVEAAGPLDMKDEEEEEEKQKERDYPLCQKALKLQMLVSGAEVEVQQLHQEALLKEKLLEETQGADPPQEAHMKQLEQGEEEEEEEVEEEEEYEVQQADIIRDAASLDDMAKLITVEEMSPASGLVSILKKRACVDSKSVSGSSELSPDKPTAKRRVRFKVSEESYENDVGGGDSCLLLFLLCLVTVVISVGGTALYCALGDAHSSVCQDFSRNADFYIGQIQRGISQILLWLSPG